jgi:hypothetical protein
MFISYVQLAFGDLCADAECNDFLAASWIEATRANSRLHPSQSGTRGTEGEENSISGGAGGSHEGDGMFNIALDSSFSSSHRCEASSSLTCCLSLFSLFVSLVCRINSSRSLPIWIESRLKLHCKVLPPRVRRPPVQQVTRSTLMM